LDVDGILEVTYAYPFPASKPDASGRGGDESGETTTKDDIDGNDYQMEMMKMLREVNVDNNCVGWYQSMYLGTMYTADVISCQYSYQSAEELSDNTIVIMYDPVQSKSGCLVLKAFKLSDEYLEIRRNKSNAYINPSNILIEIPLKIKNIGHVSAFIRCLQDSHSEELDCDFTALSLENSDAYAERHLEMIGDCMNDFLDEQKRFHLYSRSIAKPRQEHIRYVNRQREKNQERKENGEPEEAIDLANSEYKPLPEGPPRLDHILLMGQLDTYCAQVNTHIDASFHKLYSTNSLQK